MPEDPLLPHLRGIFHRTDGFQSTYGGTRELPPLPARDPTVHRANLLAQLDWLAQAVALRPGGDRVAEATRELVLIQPEPGSELAADSLADRPRDVRVVAIDESSGTVLLDAPDASLTHLRRKADFFADER